MPLSRRGPVKPTDTSPGKFERALARVSENCVVCNFARNRQKGLIFWLVKRVEGRFCPFCRAYYKVFGRMSHERIPQTDETR